jgi:hypothetical protein
MVELWLRTADLYGLHNRVRKLFEKKKVSIYRRHATRQRQTELVCTSELVWAPMRLAFQQENLCLLRSYCPISISSLYSSLFLYSFVLFLF